MIQIYKHSQFVRSISKQGWKTNRCNEAYCHVFLYSIIIFCTPIAYIKEKKGVEHSIITNVGTNNLHLISCRDVNELTRRQLPLLNNRWRFYVIFTNALTLI